MNKIEKINSYYEKNFKELEKLHDALSKAAKSNINADNYKILGWESRQAQYARFAAFAKNVDLNGKAVLDVSGAERENQTTDDILKIFNEISIECGN